MSRQNISFNVYGHKNELKISSLAKLPRKFSFAANVYDSTVIYNNFYFVNIHQFQLVSFLCSKKVYFYFFRLRRIKTTFFSLHTPISLVGKHKSHTKTNKILSDADRKLNQIIT